jgi:hypothetical protein
VIGVQKGLWRKFGAGIRGESRYADQAGLEEIQLCTAIHLSFYQLQLGVLPLGLTV